jgi:cytidine deaminase
MTTSSNPDTDLAASAWQARSGAVCRYSGFAVGSAIEAEDGRVFTGANVENASYNLGLCAERVALFYALTHGAEGFTRIAIATDTSAPTSPCGACRQVLWEFAPNAELLFVTAKGIVRRMSMIELMPDAFDARSLAEPEPDV